MKIIRDPISLQKQMEKIRHQGKSIGLVPTMGALHEGHISLVRRARKENNVVVVSIFVNPLQFGPREDFQRYPRNLSKDRSLLSKAKVDYLFVPDRRSFYRSGFQTIVELSELSKRLCGPLRPGHFRGVATVVTKLFNVVRPHRAYFGAKDYQQAQVIRQLVEDLNLGLSIKVLPTVRDRDGLALSSRNAYLSAAERQKALVIPRSLNWANREVKRGNRNLSQIRREVVKRLRQGVDPIDYVEFMEPNTLQPVKAIKGKVVLLIAGWVGKTRLIDNVIIP